METITHNQMYALLQEMNHRLKTMEIEIHELRKEPEVRVEYIEKLKQIEKEDEFQTYGSMDDLIAEIEQE
ncbi:hypothetical protein BEH94_09895 [Candidatus Altiarchaeales archaeon WOR_SM1_SCG]|nr:hypothetical protein BEH94_09895 [Candidatus Altiarchaeales archaeon WOR_SM1_SCG]ODS35182.1 MAG: hypothetical protein A7315_14895 [Candidatus Altiarchaeales archaeon WOR_SM1_79]